MVVPVSIDGSTLTALARMPFSNGQSVRVQAYIAPAPLALDTIYYIVLLSGNSFSLAATAGGAAITLTDTGTGQCEIYETPPFTWQQLTALPLVQPSDIFRVLGTPEALLQVTSAPDAAVSVTNSENVFTVGIETDFTDWTPVQLAGTLPSPLDTSTTYYVRDTTPTTFTLAASIGGAAITLTGTGANMTVANYSLVNALTAKIGLSGEWLYNALAERVIKHLSRVGWNWWTWFYPTQPVVPFPPRQSARLVLDSLRNPEVLIHAWVAFAMWAMAVDGRWRTQIVNQFFFNQFGASPEAERKKIAMEALDDICPLLEVTGDYGQKRLFDFDQVSDSVYTSLL